MFLCTLKFSATELFPHAKTLLIPAEPQFFCCRQPRAGIPTLPFLVTDSVKKITTELEFPVVLFAVNPFIYDGYKVAKNKSALYRAMKSLGMNYKFTVCAQPLKGELYTVKSFFGKTSDQDSNRQRLLQEKVYETIQNSTLQTARSKSRWKSFLVWTCNP